MADTQTTTAPRLAFVRGFRLDRYIAREILLQTGISLIALMTILLSGNLVEYIGLIVRKGLPFFRVFYLLLLSTPALLALAIPIAFLFGTLVAFSRLSADTELIAMRALGWSLKRMSVPVWILALVMSGVTLWLTTTVMPRSNRQLALEQYEIRLYRTFTNVAPRTFITDLPDVLLYVTDVSPDRTLWIRPLFIDRKDVQKRTVIFAEQARVREISRHPPQLEIAFENGVLYEFPFKNPKAYSIGTFRSYRKYVLLAPDVDVSSFPKSDREMTLSEIQAEIHRRHQQGNPFTAGLAVEYQKRISIPFAALIFALIAYPLSVRPLRGGKFYGYAVSIAIMLIAYIGILVGEKLGDQGKIPPWLAAWNPHLILGLLGLPLFVFLDRPMRRVLSVRLPDLRLRVRMRLPFRRKTELRSLRMPLRVLYLLDRYLLTLWVRVFVLTSGALLGIYLIVEAFHLVDDMVRTGSPFPLLLKYLVMAAPRIYHQILPMVVIMSLMITIATLEKFREILAMKAHGVSYFRILVPLLAGVLALVLLDYLMQDHVLPLTERRADEYKRVIKGNPLRTALHTQWALGQDHMLYHFDAYDVDQDHIYGFDLYYLDPQAWRVVKHCQAKEAWYVKDRGWETRSFWCYQFYPHLAFQERPRALLNLPEKPEYFETTRVTADQMSSAQLRAYIQLLKRRGFRSRPWEVDYAFKWINPSSSLILFPFAAALALYGAHLGVAYGIVIALILGFGHWILAQLARSLGLVEALPPLAAALLPFVATLLLGLYLMTRIRT